MADNSEKVVKKCEAGDVFGELALLYNCPRAASVDAKALPADPALVKEAAEKKRQRYDGFLSKAGCQVILEIHHFALPRSDTLEVEHFKDSDKIITEGEPGDKFYIVEARAVHH
eukprot:Skav231447  [mRNA]  locus=scaffold1847:473490:476193:- [translate_table: standard]